MVRSARPPALSLTLTLFTLRLIGPRPRYERLVGSPGRKRGRDYNGARAHPECGQGYVHRACCRVEGSAAVAPVYAAKACSNMRVRGPVVIQPERNAARTSAISSLPIAGGENGSSVSRMVTDIIANRAEPSPASRNLLNLLNPDPHPLVECRGARSGAAP